jgi:hypothetical protein
MVNPVQTSNPVNQNGSATTSSTTPSNKSIQTQSSSAKKLPQDQVTISESAAQAQANSMKTASPLAGDVDHDGDSS